MAPATPTVDPLFGGDRFWLADFLSVDEHAELLARRSIALFATRPL
jgi:hypothetical protein